MRGKPRPRDTAPVAPLRGANRGRDTPCRPAYAGQTVAQARPTAPRPGATEAETPHRPGARPAAPLRGANRGRDTAPTRGTEGETRPRARGKSPAGCRAPQPHPAARTSAADTA